ncbi:hypothetical protein [Euhalothece natronophila]|nr:hypothetical protein [Euhalothece natronophila]
MISGITRTFHLVCTVKDWSGARSAFRLSVEGTSRPSLMGKI